MDKPSSNQPVATNLILIKKQYVQKVFYTGITLLLCFAGGVVKAGIQDSIINLKDAQIITYTNRQAAHFSATRNEAGAKREFDQWLADARKEPGRKSEIAAYAFIGRFYKNTGSNQPALQAYLSALKLAAAHDDFRYLAPILMHEAGWLYYQNDANAAGLENLIKANMLMERLGYEYFPDLPDYFYELGYAFAYYYEDFSSATLYVKKALSYPTLHPQTELLSHNMLGLLYRATNDLAGSNTEFRTALQKAIQQKDTANMGEVLGNIGYNSLLHGNLDSAQALLSQDYRYSYQNENWSSACMAQMMLTNIYLARHKIDSANKLALATVVLTNQKKELLTRKAYVTIFTSLYQAIVKINKQQGNDKATISAQDSLAYFSDQLFQTKDSKEQAAIQVKLITANNDYQLKLLKSEEDRKVLLRNAAIVLCLLVAAIALLIARQQKQKARITEDKLLEYTNRLVEKNQLLEQFKMEMEQMKTQPEKQELNLEAIFGQLRSRTLLTEEDRQLFKTDFERIYKNFFTNIKDQIPDITPAEMRLLALTKLNLSTKEMADLQGVSTDAVTKARYRLKKKIELKAKESSDLHRILKKTD